jgi:UDP-N-acetylmuramate--alanine ligase
MRGLAVLLGTAGYRVDGCDRSDEARAPEIDEAGGDLRSGHDPAHVEGVDLLVHSSAVPDDHPELSAARDRGVPVWKRARALAALVNDRVLAAVAGTHGKTTITAMAGLAARAGGLDPTVVVGGRVPEWEAHAVSGAGPAALVEADEYDGSFLQLAPDLVLVSAVEEEHLESYGGMDELEDAFRRFAGRTPGRGDVLYCVDDPGARRLGRELGGAGYGFGPGAAYRVDELRPARGGRAARARLESPDGPVELLVAAPGRHNLQNAAGALALAFRLGADPEGAARALAGFRGVSRRMEVLVDVDGVAVIDDYAHHPTEVRASISAARDAWPDRRLAAVFQPHLYSRTRRFAEAFADALAEADDGLVLPVYGAREDPIPGVDAELVAGAASGLEEVDREAARERALSAGAGTVLLFMGAGDVTRLAREVAGEVERRALGA